MASFQYFFDSQNKDRVYSSQDFSRFFRTFITTGCIDNKENNLPTFRLISSENREIEVSPFSAMINGYLVRFEEIQVLKGFVPPATGEKIDSIVVRVDCTINKRNIELLIKEGTTTRPNLTKNEDIYEIAIADITTKSNGTITIKDTILDKDRCGVSSGAWDTIEGVIRGDYNLYIQEEEPLEAVAGDVWIKVNENFTPIKK